MCDELVYQFTKHTAPYGVSLYLGGARLPLAVHPLLLC